MTIKSIEGISYRKWEDTESYGELQKPSENEALFEKIGRLCLSFIGAICFFGLPWEEIDLAHKIICKGALVVASVISLLDLGHVADYTDPQQLKIMQQEAQQLTFSELIDKHGLPHLITYDILPFEIVKQKLCKEIEKVPFMDILRKDSQYLKALIYYLPSEQVREMFVKEVGNMGVLEFEKKVIPRLNLLRSMGFIDTVQKKRAQAVANAIIFTGISREDGEYNLVAAEEFLVHFKKSLKNT
ncbi:MAG: hypothetical protein K1X28_02785 [Parachlamydiales bacterium]|nr:hypothetical protein [Parachlamydiales bacterium]